MESINYVAKLNEFVQKSGIELKYEDMGSEGPAHNKTWVCSTVTRSVLIRQPICCIWYSIAACSTSDGYLDSASGSLLYEWQQDAEVSPTFTDPAFL